MLSFFLVGVGWRLGVGGHSHTLMGWWGLCPPMNLSFGVIYCFRWLRNLSSFNTALVLYGKRRFDGTAVGGCLNWLPSAGLILINFNASRDEYYHLSYFF